MYLDISYIHKHGRHSGGTSELVNKVANEWEFNNVFQKALWVTYTHIT